MISNISHTYVFLGLGIATYLLRASFILIFANRTLPDWVTRHLRYTSVAIIPGMIAPLVVFPKSAGGQIDLLWLIAALAAIVIGLRWRSSLPIMLGGGGVFIILQVMRSFGILF